MIIPVAELIRSRFFLLMGISEWRAVPLFPRDRFSFCFSLTEKLRLDMIDAAKIPDIYPY